MLNYCLLNYYLLNISAVITKSRHVAVEGRSASYGFDFAPLEEALPIMEPHLEANGFTVKWDRSTNGSMLTSVCTLRHIGGHSDVEADCGDDAAAGGERRVAQARRH